MARKKPTKAEARRILAEAKKRADQKSSLDLKDALFDKQLGFFHDQSKMKGICSSRRAGKSYTIAACLLFEGFKHPGSLCMYVAMSRADSKNILWPALVELNQKYNLGLEFKQNTGDVVLPNHSRILLRGAGSRREIDKIRGMKYPCVFIDEAQVFGADLNYLIDEVAEPATLDYNGWIGVTGTPNASCAGPFHDMVMDKSLGWSMHRWTLLDNPHLPQPIQTWLDNLCKRRGWTTSHPGYRREYGGEWLRDVEGLVFEMNTNRNLISTFPEKFADDWGYVLGIDLGYNDPTAFVVIAYSQVLGEAFVVSSYKETGLIPSTAAVHVEKLTRKYPIERIVADTGGFGKGYVEEWKKKYQLPVFPAEKNQKMTYLDLLNGDLRQGTLRICEDENKELIEEMSLLQWDSDKMAQNKWIQDRRFADHLTDAMLYGWRECKHQTLDWQLNAPTYGTQEWVDEVEEKLFQEASNEVTGEALSWWERLRSTEQ